MNIKKHKFAFTLAEGATHVDRQHDRCKFAFTLAEVLITLGIIGVVAAMTIPTVIGKYQRMVLKTQFDKAYSILQQVVERWKFEEGGDIWSLYYHPTDEKGVELRNAFFSYFKGINRADVSREIKPYYTSMQGSTLSIHNCPAGCCVEPATKSYIVVDGTMYLACARDNFINFAFDVNGNAKGPNKWGVDLFDFDLGEDNKLLAPRQPYYCITYNDSYATATNVGDGMGCTYYAVQDKDYFKKIKY